MTATLASFAIAWHGTLCKCDDLDPFLSGLGDELADLVDVGLELKFHRSKLCRGHAGYTRRRVGSDTA